MFSITHRDNMKNEKLIKNIEELGNSIIKLCQSMSITYEKNNQSSEEARDVVMNSIAYASAHLLCHLFPTKHHESLDQFVLLIKCNLEDCIKNLEADEIEAFAIMKRLEEIYESDLSEQEKCDLAKSVMIEGLIQIKKHESENENRLT